MGFFVPLCKRPKILQYLPVFAFGLCVFHFFQHQYRWQMLLPYTFSVFLMLICLYSSKQTEKVNPSTGKKILVCLTSFLGILILGISAAMAWLFPLVSLPAPDGLYAVGVSRFSVKDIQREEIFTKDAEDKREISVQVWYPGEKKESIPASYWDNASVLSALQAKSFGLPFFLFEYLSLVQTNSYWNIPVSKAKDKYPVIIFSPGFSSLCQDYTIQIENLASHGYIVCAIAHTYETLAAFFPDGRIIPYSQELQDTFFSHAQKATPLWKEYIASKDIKEKEAIVKKILHQDDFLDKNLRIRVADIHLVFRELEKIQSGQRLNILVGKLDMSSSAVIGHSLGGASAVQAALEDSHYKAAINMDGFQAGDMVLGKQPKCPVMMMYSEPFSGVNDFLFMPVRKEDCILTIQGSLHMNYSDNPFLFPITRILGSAGRIDPCRMNSLVNKYLLAFFDKHLKADKSPFPPSFPEAKIESFSDK